MMFLVLILKNIVLLFKSWFELFVDASKYLDDVFWIVFTK
jgi:hypothetical protein